MMNSTNKPKLIRITTIPLSLDKLLSGQLGFMNQFYKVIAVSSEKEYLEKIGLRENIAVKHIEMTRQITPFKDLLSLYELYTFFKKEKPLIVHSHTPKAGTVGMLAAKLAGVPNRLHTVAGLPLMEAQGLKRKLLNFVEKITYSCATKVYPNSFGLKEIIIENNFCTPAKLKVIGNGSSNGIDTSFFDKNQFSQQDIDELKKQLGINNTDFVYIFVGRLVGDKGINELINAFQMSKLTNAKLLLVGQYESELDALLPETILYIKENKNIVEVGFQPDVRPYFALADALVFPSYREGFPNVVMQAGAMGLPSIVTNINGCNEIIIDNENGLIVQVKDTKAIEKALKLIVEDKILYAHLKSNARKRIVENYEQLVVWHAIRDEYKSFT